MQFSSIYKLAQQVLEKLRKVDHPIYPDYGYLGYMMAKQDFRIFHTFHWQDPVDLGTFFKVPAMAITDKDQKSKK